MNAKVPLVRKTFSLMIGNDYK